MIPESPAEPTQPLVQRDPSCNSNALERDSVEIVHSIAEALDSGPSPFPPGELPYTCRAVSLQDLEVLFNERTQLFITHEDFEIRNTIVRVQFSQAPPSSDSSISVASSAHSLDSATQTTQTTQNPGLRAEVTTQKEHCLYMHDSVFVKDDQTNLTRVNSIIEVFAHGHPEHSVAFTVMNVVDAHTFEVELQAQQQSLLYPGREMLTPLNMHKLCGEVIIPLTVLEEYVVKLGSVDAAYLGECFENDKVFRMEEDITLPGGGGLTLKKGFTIHGRLSRRGTIRRKYWEKGERRRDQWLTKHFAAHQSSPGGMAAHPPSSRGTWQSSPPNGLQTSVTCQEVPENCLWGEEKIERMADVRAGDWIVLRRGVSYAEVCNGGFGLPVKDFISHNWSEPSKDFLQTMRTAHIQAAWICTLALNQHFIPPLTFNVVRRDTASFQAGLKAHVRRLPFYRALKACKNYGRVVMAIDMQATTLKRIWCVFECWLSFFLQVPLQLFLPGGELTFWQDNSASINACDLIQEMDLQHAESSVEEDKRMILDIINGTSNFEQVTWQVKRKLSMGAVLFLACLVSNTSTFLFSLPWISSISRTYFHSTFEGKDALPIWETLFVWGISFGSAVAHLSYYLMFLKGVRIWRTLMALRQTLSLGERSAKVFGTLAVLELVLVFCIIVALIINDPSQQKWVFILLCDRKGPFFCGILSLYLFQKTVPWIAGRCLQARGRARNFAECLPAAPCAGFLITLSVVVWATWGRFSNHDRDSIDVDFCTGGADLSNVKFDYTMINLLVCGLSAWAISVVCKFFKTVYIHLQPHPRIFRSTVFVIVLGGICTLLILSVLTNAVSVITHQSWRHFEIGFLIWLFCSIIWYRNFLLNSLSSLLRFKRFQDRVNNVRNSLTQRGAALSRTNSTATTAVAISDLGTASGSYNSAR